MKLSILIAGFFLWYNVANAQLVSYEFVQSYSLNDMNQILNNFGAAAAITPSYPVDLYRVYYKTEYNDSMTTVTGALVVPQNADCKSPLISYQHGTSATKTGVPSYGSSELQVCLVFASEGNVLVAPDYIGLGGSNINLHPYQHGFSQAHSTINLLRAARELEDSIDFELSNQLFLFGYSQGGHATAATVKYIEELYSNEFEVTAAMPMSGAYDLAGVQVDFVNSGQPYATPGYLPYIVMGYESVYHDIYDSIQEIFKAPYDSIMPYYLLDHNYSINYINTLCDPIPLNMFTDEAKEDFLNDPNFPFYVRLQENNLLSWTPQSTMRMYYCTGDEQVSYENSLVADSVWSYNGAPDVAAVNLGGEDHGGCVDDAFVAARLFFGNLQNNGIEILISYDANANSYTVAVLDEDINDYNIEWGGGETVATITDINPAVNYEVTLTHKQSACTNSMRFSKDQVTGLISLTNLTKVHVYPNPSSDYIVIAGKFDENKKIDIVDIQGKSVYSFRYIQGTEPMINIASLSNGLYYIHADGEVGVVASFVKK